MTKCRILFSNDIPDSLSLCITLCNGYPYGELQSEELSLLVEVLLSKRSDV